jgi:hypothetical protein
MTSRELRSVALTLVGEGKGILAVGGTVPTLTLRSSEHGIAWREMLFTSPWHREVHQRCQYV